MRGKILCSVLIAAFSFCSIFAQTSSYSVSDEGWEYLIVSVSFFGDKEDLAVSEKWIGRRQGKIGFSQDTLTQNEFDRIGKLGWELVGILPVNINDLPSVGYSKFIFKRKFDASRSEREAAELQKLLDEIKNRVPNPVKDTSLIELDRADFLSKENAIADKAKTALEQAIKNTSISSITNIRTNYSANNKQTSAEIVVDASAVLLKDGNKYRLSDAKKYARQIAVELFNKLGLKLDSPNEDFYSEYGNFGYRGEVFIKISITINYNGTAQHITDGYITGNRSEKIK